MAEPLGAMFIELGLDVSRFNPRLSSAKNAVKFFQQEVRGLDSVMKGSGRNIGTLQAKFKSLQQAIEAQKSVLSSMKKSFDELKPGTAQWEKQAVAIERENAKLAQLEAQLHGVGKAMDELNLKNTWLGKMETQLDKASGKFHKISEATGKLADKFAPVSASLAVGLGLATKKAIDFEGQMTTTRSLLSDTVPTVSELNRVTAKLGDNSKKWAKQYGISTTSINEGMQEIIKKGYNANQTIEAMPAILDAAKASGDDFGQVMEASTSILEQFGLKTKDTQRVTDSLTYVANKTAAGFSDMGNAMEYVGPVAKNVGMSLEDTAAAVGLLSNNGIKGEKAGTALRGALTRLLKPSDANAIAMQKLGFSAEEFRSGAIKLPDVLDRIKKNTEGMTDAQKAALIAQAFGTEAQSAMNILVDQGGDKLRKLSEETSKAKGYTHELAQEMMKSSKSGVERFKASLEVLQINIGQKLLPKLTPIIDKINGLIDAFDKASPSVQEFWTDLALGLAVAAPTLKFVSGLSGGISSLFKVASKTAGLLNTAKGIKAVGTAGELATDALSGATTAIETAGVTAGTTAESMGILGVVMSSGGAIAIGAIAVAGTVSYFAQKVLDAKRRTEEWGASVSQTEAGQLSNFKAKVDETNKAMATFGSDGAHNVDNVKKAFDNLTQEIDKLAGTSNSKLDKLAKKLGLSDEALNELKGNNKKLVDNVHQMSDDVINIYKNANEQHRQLTVEEKAIVENAQNEIINAQLSLMKKGGAERENIQKAINGHIDELNMAQKSKALDTTKKWIEDENKEYQTRKKQLSDLLKSTDESDIHARQELHAKLETLEAEHNARIDAFGKQYVAIRKSMAEETLKSLNPDAQKQYFNVIEQEMKRLGLSYDEFQGALNKAASASSSTSNIIAKNTSDMTAKTRDANTYWNALVFDAKTGEVKTNAQEEVNKAVSAEGGWEAIKFAVKEANLTSNARIMIGEALVQSGQWNSLSIQDKELLVHGQKGLQAIFESKRNLDIWNSLEPNLKELLGNNENFLGSAEVATRFLEKWNLMTPTEKALYAKDLTSGDVIKAQQTINGLLGKTVGLDAKDETILGRATAQASIDSLTGKTVDLNADPTKAQAGTGQGKAALDSYNSHQMTTKQLPSDATPAINATNQGKSALNSYNGYPIDTRQLPANSSPAVSASNQGKSALNSYNSHPISTRQLNAQDNASSVAQGVIGWFNSIPRSITTVINTIKKVTGLETGTNYHEGGPAIVNDQKGPTFKELIRYPNGETFIPEGRNVLLDLPRGTKVFPARKTRQLMQNLGIPKYQNGVGIPSDAKFLKELDRVQNEITIESSNNATIDINKLVDKISSMENTIATLLKALLDKDSSVYLDGKAIAENTYKQQARIMAREGI